MGVAFPRMRPFGGLVPAVTLKLGGSIEMNFGQAGFVHNPPELDGRYKPVCKGRSEEGYALQVQVDSLDRFFE
jgi:hypothetical protein